MAPRIPEVGPLEMEALGILDSAAKPLPVSAIQSRLKAAGKNLAYTTVMTVMARLHAKGLLTRKREGKQFLYLPGGSVSLLKESMLDRIRRSFFSTDQLKPILALLTGDTKLSVGELKELRGVIDKKIKGAEAKA